MIESVFWGLVALVSECPGKEQRLLIVRKGHLGIQFASKMGMEVVVFSSTDSKREEAMRFGAAEFVATKGVKQFEGIKPLDALLVSTSVLPDFNL